MMPTLLDLVGAPVPEGVEGVSFAKHMLGEADAPSGGFTFWMLRSVCQLFL